MNGPTQSHPPVTLANCDSEPIHVPGAIQPLGALLAFDAVGCAHQRAGPPLDMRQHPAAYRFIIACQFQLGDRFAVTGIGP